MNEPSSEIPGLKEHLQSMARRVLEVGQRFIDDRGLKPDDKGYFTIEVLMSAGANLIEEKFAQDCGFLIANGVPGVASLDLSDGESDDVMTIEEMVARQKEGTLQVDESSEKLTPDEIHVMDKFRQVSWNPSLVQQFLD